MYFQVSKDLDEPARGRRLIVAPAFPSVFTLYIVLVWDVFLYLSMFSGFKSNQYEGNKRRKDIYLHVILLSPYLCFISLLYLDLYVLGDDALIIWGLSCKPNIYVS